MHHWLVKSEPDVYPWSDFVKEGRTAWTGVRNYQARINLRAMKKGDPVLFYHSGADKKVVGLARVEREAYPDPTAKEGDWVCVDLVAVEPLAGGVSLQAVKADRVLRTASLVTHGRLSVSPLTPEQYRRILELGRSRGNR